MRASTIQLQTASDVNRRQGASRDTRAVSPNGGVDTPVPVVQKGKLINPFGLNNFFRWVNGEKLNEVGKVEKSTYFCLRDITKAIWPLYLPLQIFGLFNERAAKLAKAWYGACWTIVYSCLRPWKNDRDELTDVGVPKKISDSWKKVYNANEYFRVGMGSLVSGIYGSGAFGMLWGAVTGNDDFFDKSAEVYKTGMLNQNQIFASMNADIVMRRKLNINQLKTMDKDDSDRKAKIEMIDSLLFIPNIVTRGLDTLRLFGMDLNEGLQRVVNSLGYFSYGTWAAKFGIMKSTEENMGGDLRGLKETKPTLYRSQKVGGHIFSWSLSIISWAAAAAELIGMRELAEKIFKLEGYCERLNWTIASWCMEEPWLKGLLKLLPGKKNNTEEKGQEVIKGDENISLKEKILAIQRIKAELGIESLAATEISIGMSSMDDVLREAENMTRERKDLVHQPEPVHYRSDCDGELLALMRPGSDKGL